MSNEQNETNVQNVRQANDGELDAATGGWFSDPSRMFRAKKCPLCGGTAAPMLMADEPGKKHYCDECKQYV